ncbi:MAG TPA: permease [Candidatus Acidoferrales bacterium]
MADILKAGLLALQDYIALHVLTCLVPAFLLAGAMVTFVSREAILHYLGTRARKATAFPLAAGSSFFVAACSCTVIPVASGLYYGGAGIGAAFIVLWVAPAANLLALVYTGAVLGTEMVIVRVVSALLMAFVVGLIMAGAFRKEEQQREQDLAAAAPAGKTVQVTTRGSITLLVLLVVTLLAPNYLVQSGPYLHKVYVWAAATALTAAYAWRVKTRAEIIAWLKETWWFVRIIFPLLLAGVFVVGVIGHILPEEWIRQWLGGNGLLASFLATLIGSISYFATMTEAPFVDTLMKLGMGKGPALALLLTGPGLSLPNWLAIARVFGPRKALVYVATLIVLGTLVGWAAGQLYFT